MKEWEIQRIGCAEPFQFFAGAAQADAAAAGAKNGRQEVGRNPSDQAVRGRLPGSSAFWQPSAAIQRGSETGGCVVAV